MPSGDGTGPQGMGPMTGRAAGYCAGYGVPGYANGAPRGGWGGRGRGRGWGNRGGGFGGRRMASVVPAPPAAAVPQASTAEAVAPQAAVAAELSALKQQTANLVSAIDGLLGRIESLESRRDTQQ